MSEQRSRAELSMDGKSLTEEGNCTAALMFFMPHCRPFHECCSSMYKAYLISVVQTTT